MTEEELEIKREEVLSEYIEYLSEKNRIKDKVSRIEEFAEKYFGGKLTGRDLTILKFGAEYMYEIMKKYTD